MTSQNDQRVITGILNGDRLCTRCSYNLIGQPIRRHTELDLLAVQCPECGLYAAIQEYPLLGRWANRWMALLAGLWLIALVLALFITSAMILGVSTSTVESAVQPYARFIVERQNEWLESQPGAQNTPSWQMYTGGNALYQQLDQSWWSNQDAGALLEEAGGWWHVIDKRAVLNWGWYVAMVLPAGVFWSVALLYVRRRWLFGVALLVVLIAAGMAALNSMSQSYAFQSWVRGVVVEQIGQPVLYLSTGATIVPLLIGMYLGRPVARLAVRVLLPPRLRSALAILWTAEGKAPPRRAFWEQPIRTPPAQPEQNTGTAHRAVHGPDAGDR